MYTACVSWLGAMPELVAQTSPQLVVDEQRVRAVAAGREELHQQPIAALAVGRAGDEPPAAALRRVELAAADLDARPADELQRAQVQLLELAAMLLDPRRGLAGQQLARADVLRHATRRSRQRASPPSRSPPVRGGAPGGRPRRRPTRRLPAPAGARRVRSGRHGEASRAARTGPSRPRRAPRPARAPPSAPRGWPDERARARDTRTAGVPAVLAMRASTRSPSMRATSLPQRWMRVSKVSPS